MKERKEIYSTVPCITEQSEQRASVVEQTFAVTRVAGIATRSMDFDAFTFHIAT